MRPVRVTLNALGYSQWVPLDWTATWFGAAVGVIPSVDSGWTYAVQYTFDSPDPFDYNSNNSVTISRAATTATVTDAGPNNIGHGLSTGDSVIVASSGSLYLDSLTGNKPQFGNGDVGWNITEVSTTSYTYPVQNLGATADAGNARVARLRVFPATLSTGTATTRGTVTFNYPVRAVRLQLVSGATGFVDMEVIQGVGSR